MSKRQSDYLSSLLGDMAKGPTSTTQDVEKAAPSPTARNDSGPVAETHNSHTATKGMTLLARESALARVAAGEVKQVTQLLLDPSRVRVWGGNARYQASLSEDSCRDLIDAIIAEGGQKVPAIVRRVNNDPQYDYEVIAGSRRLWAIGWLRANNYPEMMFLAQVHALDDEAAFRLSDIENRARKDVSDFERARTYLAALSAHYGGKQVRMAERLRLSKGWLSKMLTVAALPSWAVDAFASPADIQLKGAYPLAQKIQSLTDQGDKDTLELIKMAAAALKDKQQSLIAQAMSSIAAADVIQTLMTADRKPTSSGPLLHYEMPSGRTALSILSANRNGISVRLHAGSGASEAELLRLLKTALHELEAQGKGLQ